MLARMTTGGHLGLFMGTEALRDHWPEISGAWRSGRRPRSAKQSGDGARATPRRRRAIPAP